MIPYCYNKLNQLFELLRARKCLLIFDELENLFIPNQLAGQCQPQYQDYQNFFKRIMETDHQSHAILISQEKCQEMKYLDCNLYPIKCLELSGLKDINFLKNMGLKDEDSWLNLLTLYEGNPFYLQNIIYCINNIFDGFVREFLAEKELIITKEIEIKLQLLFNRLSPKEQEIVLVFCNSEKLLSREELKTSLDLSSTNLINALESLQNRYLLEKIIEQKIVFKLSSIFRSYLINNYLN
ncbi:hypothetical protein [Geminocystis herdmanii]|uniref:hypothetical protein n=1 Tax=Geminocystis herdmanii TaxID=669359 RepID=UPI00034B55E3|nr:hypothetical protein [Geminocystis herdmanii]